MLLSALIDNLPLTVLAGPSDAEVSNLTDDSRRVAGGTLFIARGAIDDRALGFVRDAVEAGAVAVMTRAGAAAEALDLPTGVAHVVAGDGVAVDQRLAGQVAECFFDHPASKLALIGITGTNGKTTTATIAQHLLRAAGRKPGLLGTVHLDTGHPDGPRPAELTTPGAVELSRLLAEMVSHGCDSAVMEVSSHALHQGRADHLRFAAAGFTNLTQDHLDYHGTMDAYADAKALLFESLDEDATAVVNGDDPAAERMLRGCKAEVVATHVTHDSVARDERDSCGGRVAIASAAELAASHSRAMFTGPWGGLETTLPLVGSHNLANALQAAALAHAVTGVTADTLRTALDACPPVPGRLEPVGPDWPQPPTPNPQLPTILVDYAHTPDALVNVAQALRDLTPPPGRLVVVFGCGGDRDRAKRPLMAQAACKYADAVVLTSDNPRTEDPRQILDDAAAGFAGGLRGEERGVGEAVPDTRIEIDRAKAIRLAIDLAGPGDTVLIAGKGHEDYQIIGTTKHHFDDREHAADALRSRKVTQPQ